MSFIRRLLGVFSSGPTIQTGTQSAAPGGYLYRSAATVTFDSAMTVSAFWASVRLISETIAAMPLICYRFDGDTRRVITDYSLWRVLNYRPNRYQTKVEFFESMVMNLAAGGNAYAAIERDGTGRIISLIPLMAAQTEVSLLPDGEVVYANTIDGRVRVYAASSIWHIKLFGNGIIGLSPLAYARQSLGIALASDRRASKIAETGKSTGILTIDHVLKPEQREAVRANFAGLEDGGQDGLFVLEAGMTYQQTSLSPVDAQLLETRKFQIEDIARFMGVPSVLINDNDGSSTLGSNVKEIVEGFYKLNLRPYLERIESSIKRHLIPPADWDTVEFEFDFDSLLRMDPKTRFETYREGVNSGTMTPNEARALEGRDALPGGDDLIVNGTMVPLDSVRARLQTQGGGGGN